MPKALLDRPELCLGLDIYMVAYHDLLSDRQLGMDFGQIPWSAIHRWGVFHGVTDPTDLETLVYHIRQLENCDRQLEAKRNAK